MCRLLAVTLSFLLFSQFIFVPSARANTTPQLPGPPFTQDWTNTALIAADDDWSNVPGVVGFRGDGLAGGTGVNPQTVVAESLVVDVNANQLNPNGFATGGVSEFHLPNPVVALQGSGTARAPYVQFHVNTTGLANVNVAYNLRDIDGSADNAVQAVALQFRVGSTGNFTNVAAGFVADATTGGAATLVTPVSAALPAAAENKPLVQVRVITTDAVGSDEWVGIDDVQISGAATPTTNPGGAGAAAPNQVVPGGTTVLSVAVTPGTNPVSTAHAVTANLSAIGGPAAQVLLDNGADGDAVAGDNVFSHRATVANDAAPGAKALPFTVAETSPQSRAATGSISLNVLAQTSPAGAGAANPDSLLPGASTTLTVNVTPGANPASTNLAVTADLSAIGGPAAQAFGHDGGNSFSLSATVAGGTTPGAKSLPVSITDGESRTGATTISLNVEPPPQPLDHVVISQIYGGGGNANATFRNDFVELHNPTAGPVDLGGWTIQYASATGTTWQAQPLGGVMQPGEYYLISLASGGAAGAALPDANVGGDINMSGTTGKVALSNGGDPLDGCPTGDPTLVDLVGYGTANCREGAANAPAPSSTNALFRKNGGAIDTNVNGGPAGDFVTGTPAPRRTTPITEIGPYVLSVDPRRNTSSAARDASISVTFTEPVEVADGWYDLNCAATGSHNDATVAGAGRFWVVTPNVNFQHGEQCTVTVFRNAVQDTDLDDNDPGGNNLKADYTWTFTVTGAGAPAPYPRSVHLTLGNPTDATADLNQPNNYLMEKDGFTLSYNRDRGTPNWVSWHLEPAWYGTLQRVDSFRPDPAVPSDWYRVQSSDYFSSGFDRGHMTPNADRDHQDSLPRNQETFLMTNMIPQAPDNNQGPWANLENHLRTVTDAGNEVYVVSGPAGVGGAGSAGQMTTIAGGRVTVPSHTWKVVLVLPRLDGDDVARVTAAARTIAVIMPNVQGIRTNNQNDWQNYLTTVDAVEQLTGYDLFENLPDAVENAVEAGVNGVNPPGAEDGAFTTAEDTPSAFTMTAAGATAPLTYTVVGGPAHGTLSGAGATRTYTPAADFAGTDSLTFRVSDGTSNSNVSTVSILVTEANDAPTAADDAKATQEDTPLNFAASDLAANDSAGPANEGAQALAVTAVNPGPDTHGTVSLSNGQITYTPAADYHGPASFTYTACDDGTTAGSFDSKCAAATVNVAVAAVNDKPGLTVPAAATVPELAAHAFTAQATDADGDQLTFSLAGAPAGATIDPSTGRFNWTPSEAQGGTGAPFVFTVRVSDGTSNVDSTASITVTEVNQAPVLAPVGSKTVLLGGTLTFAAQGADADLPAQALAYSLTGAFPAGASIDPATGVFTWTPTAAQSGQTYTFGVRVTDDGAGTLHAEEAITVGAGYAWSGFLQPVNQDGSSVFKLGRTIPVKFRLTGASAGVTNAVARLYVAKVANSVAGSEDEADSTSNATAGNLFRYADGQYVFNLSTDGLTAGTYQLRVDTGDGVQRLALISLR